MKGTPEEDRESAQAWSERRTALRLPYTCTVMQHLWRLHGRYGCASIVQVTSDPGRYQRGLQGVSITVVLKIMGVKGLFSSKCGRGDRLPASARPTRHRERASTDRKRSGAHLRVAVKKQVRLQSKSAYDKQQRRLLLVAVCSPSLGRIVPLHVSES